MNVQEQLSQLSELPLSGQTLSQVLRDYARPYDKTVELVKEGKLTQLKRGLYIAGPELHGSRPEKFTIANHLYGPSYVSGESALDFYDLIPERVFPVISATTHRPGKFSNPAGEYLYFHVPIPYYFLGITTIELTEKQHVLIATREKALCDTVIFTKKLNIRSVRQARSYLLEDLRMDSYQAAALDHEAIMAWSSYAPKRNSLTNLAKALSTL